MNKIEQYNTLFQSLHTNVQKGKPAPHKALLLLAIIDLIEDGTIYNNRIFLSDELEATYKKLWKKLLGKSLLFTPDVYKPYYHMNHEPFWELIPVEPVSATSRMVADESQAYTNVPQKKEEPRYTMKWMRSHYKYAEIDSELFRILQDENVRAQLRLTLIGTYLVGQPIEMPLTPAIKLSSISLLSAILALYVA